MLAKVSYSRLVADIYVLFRNRILIVGLKLRAKCRIIIASGALAEVLK